MHKYRNVKRVSIGMFPAMSYGRAVFLDCSSRTAYVSLQLYSEIPIQQRIYLLSHIGVHRYHTSSVTQVEICLFKQKKASDRLNIHNITT